MSFDPCELFSEIDVNDSDPIFQRLRMNALKNCVPLFVSIELTQNCNFRCRHCYNFDRTQKSRPPENKEGLTLDEWKKILHQIKESGGLFISFTGGEVLTYPHLFELLDETRKIGLSARLKTNAALIDQVMADKLKDYGVELIEVSFYGISENTHNYFTTTRGQLKKVREGILAIRKARIEVMVNIILHRGNILEYGKMKSWLEQEDLKWQVSFDMTVRHDGTRGSLDHRVSLEELEKLFSSDAGRGLLPESNPTGNIQCGCARVNCGIGHDGKVYPCIGAPILSGDLREKTFDEIWKSSPVFKRIRGLKSESFKSCHNCEDRNYCQRSSGLMYLNTGNYTGADELTCQTASMIKRLNLGQ